MQSSFIALKRTLAPVLTQQLAFLLLLLQRAAVLPPSGCMQQAAALSLQLVVAKQGKGKSATRPKLPDRNKQGFCLACGVIHRKASGWASATVRVEDGQPQLYAGHFPIQLDQQDPSQHEVAQALSGISTEIQDMQGRLQAGEAVFVVNVSAAPQRSAICSARMQVKHLPAAVVQSRLVVYGQPALRNVELRAQTLSVAVHSTDVLMYWLCRNPALVCTSADLSAGLTWNKQHLVSSLRSKVLQALFMPAHQLLGQQMAPLLLLLLQLLHGLHCALISRFGSWSSSWLLLSCSMQRHSSSCSRSGYCNNSNSRSNSSSNSSSNRLWLD
jgi:hypothetical protein